MTHTDRISAPPIGHNSGDVRVRVTARLFNSMAQYAGPAGHETTLDLPAGCRVSDVVDQLNLPIDKIFLVLVNGKDVTAGQVGDMVSTTRVLDDGDIIAFSGPVPFSWGYGAPVV